MMISETTMTTRIYSKTNCPQCAATYRQFDKHGIAYEVIDVETNQTAFEYVKQLGFMQMPVVITDTDSWSGFRPDKIKQLSLIGVPA